MPAAELLGTAPVMAASAWLQTHPACGRRRRRPEGRADDGGLGDAALVEFAPDRHAQLALNMSGFMKP
jgi:hypothetical protein